MRGLAAVITGSVLGQGLVLLASPLLTRLFDPSDFGLLGVFTALVAILGVLSTARLEMAVLLPGEDGRAAAVAWAALSLAVVVGLAVIVVGAVAGTPIAEVLGAPELDSVWWLVGLATASVGAGEVMAKWLVRTQSYGLLGGRNGLQGAAQVTTQLCLGAAGAGPIGLLLGLPAGRLAGVGGLITRGGLLRQGRPTVRAMWHAVVRYRRFPLVASWAAVLNSAGLQMPILLVSAAYGQANAGLLALTVRVVAAPAVFIGNGVADVFIGEVGALVREGRREAARAIRATTGRLLAVGIVPAIVLAVLAPWLFGFVFGEQWAQAGQFAQFLVVGYLAQFVVTPVSQILNLLERQTWQLTWDVLRIVLVVGSLLVCVVIGAPVLLAVAAISVASLASYGVLFWICHRAARRFDHGGPAAAVPIPLQS